jgi:hypothetical protein
MFNWNNGCHELIISKNAFESLMVVHPSIVEHLPPGFPPKGLNLVKLFVNQQEHAPATGAGVKQLINAVFSTAAKALIDHLTLRLWTYVFLYLHRKLIESHDSFLIHEIAVRYHEYLKSH